MAAITEAISAGKRRIMTRLTSRDKHGHAYFPQCFRDPCNGSGCQRDCCDFLTEVCERLAQYEEAERKEHENKDMAKI